MAAGDELFHLHCHLSYDFGGDTGACTLIDVDFPAIDLAKLNAEIDRLGEQLRVAAKRFDKPFGQ